MLAERPVLRSRLQPPEPYDAPYPFLTVDDCPGASPHPIGLSLRPSWEEAERVRASKAAASRMDVGREEDRRRPASPAASTAPGLYDLPGLLARIWSVPVARLATSGSYTQEAARTPPPPPVAGPEPHPPSVAPVPSIAPPPWWYPSVSPDPSLPLAAVPTLTGARPRPPTSPLTRPESGPVPELPAFNPTTHYVSWRRPPCHLPYTHRFDAVRGADEGSRPGITEIGRVSVTTEPYPSPSDALILPASLPWTGTRGRVRPDHGTA